MGKSRRPTAEDMAATRNITDPADTAEAQIREDYAADHPERIETDIPAKEFETPEGETYESTEANAPEDKPVEAATAWDSLQQYQAQEGYIDPFNTPSSGSAFDMDEEIMIDTTGASIRGIPPGTYKGRCVGIRPGKPSGAGDPCYVWTFQAMLGEHAGQTMDQYTYTGPKTLWKFAETKFALGFGEKDAISPRKIMNRACIFIVGESVYQGKTRTSLDTVVAPQDRPIGSVWEGDPEVAEPPPF